MSDGSTFRIRTTERRSAPVFLVDDAKNSEPFTKRAKGAAVAEAPELQAFRERMFRGAGDAPAA